MNHQFIFLEVSVYCWRRKYYVLNINDGPCTVVINAFLCVFGGIRYFESTACASGLMLDSLNWLNKRYGGKIEREVRFYGGVAMINSYLHEA